MFKTHLRGRDAIVFDIWWYMFVMRMAAGQADIIWMWL